MRDPIMDPEGPAAVAPSTPASDVTATAEDQAADAPDAYGDLAETGMGTAEAEPLAAREPEPEASPAVPADELDEPAEPQDAVATAADEPALDAGDTAGDTAVEAAVAREPVTGDVGAAPVVETVPSVEVEGAEPVGADLVVPEPAAHAIPPTGGVWTDEQVEAVRTRVRDVTANAADKATGAVMAAVNMVAAAIRSRTSSSDRPRDGGQG